jgi:hypothetical protein
MTYCKSCIDKSKLPSRRLFSCLNQAFQHHLTITACTLRRVPERPFASIAEITMQFLTESIIARMPHGTKKRVIEAAARQGLHPSQYVRTAILKQLAADGLPLPGLPYQLPRKPTP